MRELAEAIDDGEVRVASAPDVQDLFWNSELEVQLRELTYVFVTGLNGCEGRRR